MSPRKAKCWKTRRRRCRDYVYSRTVNPEDAPDKPTFIEIEFKSGDPVAVDGKELSPAALLTHLNALGRVNGIGRLDLVENRFVGMKSRGMYETPGGTILLAAHRGIEQITLDRGAAHLKDELMPKYAELIYNGFWFSPEREMLQALIDKSQEFVTGKVRLETLQGPRRRRRPLEAPIRSTIRISSPSRTARSPTITRRGGLHQAQCAALAHSGPPQEQSGEVRASELCY